MNRRDRDDKCALCDEFSVKHAAPEFADLGMGRCQKNYEHGEGLNIHVGWNAVPCVSYRVDRNNLAARRQYIAMQMDKEKA